MAKARGGAAADPGPLSLGGGAEETELVDEQDAEDIESVYAQIDDEEATVTVKRRDPDDAKVWQYLTRMPARLFSLEQIKAEYGGGEYKAQAFDKRGKIVAGGPKLFHIDKAFKPKVTAATAGPSDNGAPRAVSPDVAALSARLDQLTALLTAQNSSKETLDMAIRMATVMAGGSNRAGLSPESVLGILKTGVELRDRFAGEGDGGGGGGEEEGGGDMFGSALRELVRPVARLLESEVERRAQTRRLPAAPTSGAQQPTQPATREEPVAGNAAPWLRQLAPWIPQLLSLAREGANPRLYAEVVLDRMDRSLTAATIAAVEEAARGDDFVPNIMAALPPACQQHGEWFRTLATELKEQMTRPEESDEVVSG